LTEDHNTLKRIVYEHKVPILYQLPIKHTDGNHRGFSNLNESPSLPQELMISDVPTIDDGATEPPALIRLQTPISRRSTAMDTIGRDALARRKR